MKRSKNGCDESDQFKSEGVYIQWELGYGEKIGHTNCQVCIGLCSSTAYKAQYGYIVKKYFSSSIREAFI